MTAPHPDPMREMGRLLAELADLLPVSPTLPQCLKAAAQKRK